MKYAVNSKQMKQIDDYSVEVCKIPALELMERAANEVVAVMKNRIMIEDRILVVCGPGNNGGDGVAAGRILYLQGYHVAILFIGYEEKASASMKVQLERARNIGVPLENCNKLHEYNIIIDAIFGVGLSRDVSGEYEEIICNINSSSQIVFAVDIPSGISADSGKVMKVAVKADYTITFGYQKLGLLLYPGAEYAGTITVADIGFPEEATKQASPDTFYYGPEDLHRLPERKNYSNKGTYGKVLIIAGSKGMSGAAFLSAKAAYRTGAGLVKVLTSEANRQIIQTSIPEALFAAYDEDNLNEDERQEKLLEALAWASVVVIGPGIGLSGTAEELVETIIKKAKVPVIIDADAITLLSKKMDQKLPGATVKGRLDYLSAYLNDQTILTPHLMELSRLIGIPVSEIINNLIDTAHQCSYNNKLIYAIKDARSIVTQGMNTCLNISGNNGMATGGSGDVLTGIMAALIAQGMEAYETACLAVYLHGLAGDAAANEKGVYSLMASDIVNSIEKVIRRKGKR
ncbi:MAG TPA: NAD(P)H-hydrate dehydratase [Mobilitalea sp.]|nr:NAD(P)H-hydrate dehydratase [Mobilitalea sp.]